jgi:tRNA (guanine37-N1)-methyltransferase
MFPGPLGASLAGRALAEGKVEPRRSQHPRPRADKHRSVDDTPQAAGPGWCFVPTCLPPRSTLWRMAARSSHDSTRRSPDPEARSRPRGRRGAIVLCGRFEASTSAFSTPGRSNSSALAIIFSPGGELGAMVLLDACIRLLPGVMGAASSGEEESFETALLEYPHYTRPYEWEGRTIPEVLRSGDHAKIAAWRKARSIETHGYGGRT